MLPSTSPGSPVTQLLQQRFFSTKATDWGKKNEPISLEKYQEHQTRCAHTDLIFKAGFVVPEQHLFLGASPDAYGCETLCTTVWIGRDKVSLQVL